MERKLLIAIDGPAGSGKSTVARAVAARLGLPYIDTGSMYRALTLKALRRGVPLDDGSALGALAEATEIALAGDAVSLDGEDVTSDVRGEAVDAAVSEVSARREVRRRMVAQQRGLAGGRAVMAGRDIGTVVLPEATLKVFLTAAPEERARRRLLEREVHEAVTVEDMLREISERDRTDSEREASPLAAAADAVVIDSTGRTIEEIVEEIVRMAERRAGRS